MILHYGVKNATIVRANTLPITYGLVVKWLSRLPVTEEIAGSNPVEPAKKLSEYHLVWYSFYILSTR